MDKNASHPNPFTYLAALWSDWLTRMCGALSVPFTAIAVLWANAPSAKLLWGCLAILAFVMAGYRVWSNERNERTNEVGDLRRKLNGEIEGLKSQVTLLKRKPYDEELGRQAAGLIARLSPEGKLLLRHLLTNEPIEVGRRFRNEIAQDIQDAQMSLAYGSGIVRHNQLWAGNGHLLRTDYVVNPPFRRVLQDLLFGTD